MLLDVYGGIYTDGDVVYLRDMQILSEYTFAYRWSSSNEFNTAVMGLNREKEASNQDLYSVFISRTNTMGAIVRSLHPKRLSRLIRYHGNQVLDFTPLQVLHVSLFDPAWLCNDEYLNRTNGNLCSFGEFTANRIDGFKAEEFFPGAFVYHIHLSVFGVFSLFGYEFLGKALEIKEFSYFHYFEIYYRSLLHLN